MKLTNNRKFFLNIFSAVMIAYGIAAMPSVFAALYFGNDRSLIPLAIVSSATIICGIIIRHLYDLNASVVRPRMNYMAVMMSWLASIALTSAVFYFSVAEFSVTTAIFEATACLTTTGVGNLGIESLPESLMLWRSVLSWLGGVGIILIAFSFISGRQLSGRALVSVEVPGPDFLKSTQTFRYTYRHIIRLYAVLTAVHFVLLCIAGMTPYTSLLTSMSNISTAGLQHISNGDITALPGTQKAIIVFFSFISSLNVSFLLMMFFRRSFSFRRTSEIGVYTLRVVITSVVIAAVLCFTRGMGAASAVADALMQTVSYLSTSGYIVSGSRSWPFICELLILLQMFVGACAASTAGGIKTARIQIGFKTMRFGLFRHVHPNAVRPVRINGETVKPEQLVGTNIYIALFMLVYILGALLLSLDNKNESVFDALNYSQAMLTNTGTTVADMTRIGGYSGFSPLSQIVMSIEMLCGRLEIYPFLMLFFKSFWKSDSNR